MTDLVNASERFHFVRRIGAGGMGVVYEVDDLERSQKVALKTLASPDVEKVYRLKREFPALTIAINGGITTDAQLTRELDAVDGVMVGREAYHHPWWLAGWDALCGAPPPAESREAVELAMVEYMERQAAVVSAGCATGADLHLHYRPGVWLPHSSLATSVRREAMPVLAAAAFDVMPFEAVCDRLALVDSGTGERWPPPHLA